MEAWTCQNVRWFVAKIKTGNKSAVEKFKEGSDMDGYIFSKIPAETLEDYGFSHGQADVILANRDRHLSTPFDIIMTKYKKEARNRARIQEASILSLDEDAVEILRTKQSFSKVKTIKEISDLARSMHKNAEDVLRSARNTNPWLPEEYPKRFVTEIFSGLEWSSLRTEVVMGGGGSANDEVLSKKKPTCLIALKTSISEAELGLRQACCYAAKQTESDGEIPVLFLCTHTPVPQNVSVEHLTFSIVRGTALIEDGMMKVVAEEKAHAIWFFDGSHGRIFYDDNLKVFQCMIDHCGGVPKLLTAPTLGAGANVYVDNSVTSLLLQVVNGSNQKFYIIHTSL